MIQSLATFTFGVWCVAAFALFFFGWLNYPVLGGFIFLRWIQVRGISDGHADARPTPFRDGLLLVCTVLYGIILPAFYFVSVRLRHDLSVWPLGPHTNQRWTIALGVFCMIWLAHHVPWSASSKNRFRFGGTTDRIVGGLSLGLCLWFHACTLIENCIVQHNLAEFPIFLVAYPQSFFLGATIVYGFAFYEALRSPVAPVPERGLKGWAPSFVAMAIIFAPWWLSLPRVTDAEAMRLLDANRSSIIEVAHGARIDPRLLAGVIYVAQTRDQPRLTGEFFERFGVQLNAQNFGRPEGVQVFDSSIGLCQMRPSTYIQIVEALDTQFVPKLHLTSRESLALFEYRPREFSNAIKYPGGGKRYRDDLDTGELLKPEISLNCTGLMLHLLKDQWQRGGFPIDNRPEILATLYNLGFERSVPKSDPMPNDFGRRVKAFMDSPECHKWLVADHVGI